MRGAKGRPLWGFREYFSWYFHLTLLFMWGVLGAYHSFNLHQKSERQQLEASELENRLVRAQNQALRMRLQPHYLFNTLNSISTLMDGDPESGDRMMVRRRDGTELTLSRTYRDSFADKL